MIALTPGKLTEEDHNIGVHNGTASTRLGEEIQPWEALSLSAGNNACLLFLSADLHDKEFFSGFDICGPTHSLSGTEGVQQSTFVHKEAR
jgi:hypothetical protein